METFSSLNFVAVLVPLTIDTYQGPLCISLNQIEVLSCKFRGFPYPKVFWKGGSDFFTSYKNEYSTSKLYVKDGSKSYTCIANSSGDEISQHHTFKFNVAGKKFKLIFLCPR